MPSDSKTDQPGPGGAGGTHFVDIGSVLDQDVWTGFRIGLIVLTALLVILDGFDNQALGYAIPAMMRDWSLRRPDFVLVLMGGFAGMAIGSGIAGWLGDRIGRRRTLIGSTLLFAAATASIGAATGLIDLGLLRFLAGLGIGGALPNAAVMAAEYAPARRRAAIVTMTIVCVPLGGMVAGMVSGVMLPAFGWRAYFLAGGLAPLLLAGILFACLPESPRFLAHRPNRSAELARIISRLGHRFAAGTVFIEQERNAPSSKGAIAAIFGRPFLRDTLGLWASFFCCLTTVYVAASWLPTMLVGEGLDPLTAGSGLVGYNMGGVVGALAGAWMIGRLGSRASMLLLTFGGIVSAVILIFIPIGHLHGLTGFMLLLGANGLFANAVQTTMYALAANIYPTEIRATGVGSAVAFGRLGAVLSPLAGSLVIDLGGAPTYFALAAALMIATFMALASIRRHVPAGTPMIEAPAPLTAA